LICLTASPPQTRHDLASTLREIWGEQSDESADRLIALTWEAMPPVKDR